MVVLCRTLIVLVDHAILYCIISQFVIPEMVVHASMCVGFLLTWHYVMFLITLPITAWNSK